jgi:hypothetical protein
MMIKTQVAARVRAMLASMLLFMGICVSLGTLAALVLDDGRVWALYCVAVTALAFWMSRELYRTRMSVPAGRTTR